MKIRYYGHVGERTGYGVAARAMCRALLAAGAELEIRPIEPKVQLSLIDDVGDTILLSKHLTRPDDLCSDPDATIVHTMPGDCAKVLGIAVRDEHLDHDRPAVAYTTWEGMSQAPMQTLEDLTVFDQCWTPSHASANGFAQSWDRDQRRPTIGDRNGTPVLVMPHAYDPEHYNSVHVRAPLSTMPRPYRFIYVGAWTSRKNPAGLIRAFAYADFGVNDAELWIQSTGTPRETFAVALHQTGCVDDKLARIRFFNEPLSSMQMREQFRNADCFVSATRGEAWNLPCFEAALSRAHVIVPSAMGMDEFLVHTSADLITEGLVQPCAIDVRVTGMTPDGINLQTVGAQGLSARGTWWDPDLTELAGAMRIAAATERRDLTWHENPADHFSYEAVGKRALRYLEDLNV